MTHEVFISYSHHDKSIADGVCANLEGAGIRCWIAPRDIAPGHDWPASISDAIAHSRVMVLIFSSRSNKSEDVSRELILAADSRLIIVPFKIEDIEPEPGKKYYLARTHWLDAMDPPTREQVDALVKCVHSLLLETGVALEVNSYITKPTSPVLLPVNKRRALPWILGAFVLVIIFSVGGALLWTQRDKIAALIAPSVTPSPTVSPTLHPTITPTHTNQPTDSPTPIPSWVSDFAQPILAAIADTPPTFQDDFGPSSDGWYNALGWAATRIQYENEEIVVTGCGLGHAALNIPDFVLEVDGRFLETRSFDNVDWSIYFRETSYSRYLISLIETGRVEIQTNEVYSFDGAAHAGTLTNHLLLIAKGTSIAFFINDQPLYFSEDIGRWGGNWLGVWNDASTTSEILPSVAFDNFKIWDINYLP